MPKAPGQFNGKIILALGWTLFTSSLAVWWLVFGLRQLNRVDELSSRELISQQKMLFWEGGILIALLLLGGGTIIYFMFRLYKANESLKQFFATFSHELRTSISSLRLQAESLRDDWPDDKSPQLPRLVQESVRLQLQLENSLNLAQHESSRLFLQDVSVKKLLSSIHHQWPTVKIQVRGEDGVHGDERALHSIFTNLIQNAAYHGGASEVVVELETTENDKRKILVRDNGKGFDGDKANLSKLFVRHNQRSGSGVGLFLVKTLVNKMNGSFEFILDNPSGFAVSLQLPKGGAA